MLVRASIMKLFAAVLALVIFTTARCQSNDSCEGRCGPGHDNTKPCQCNTACTSFGDCCSDYQLVCVGTCAGRCGAALDNTKPCQCNPSCVSYGDCCSDYSTLCGSGGGTCETLATVTEYFRSNDVNGLTSSQYTVNWGSAVADGNTADSSPSNFFTFVDQAAYSSKTTITAFLALLNNYDPYIGTSEFQTSQERTETDTFYNLIRATPIFNKLYQYLLCRGRVSSDADFMTKFYNLWFDLYPRSSSNTRRVSSDADFKTKFYNLWFDLYPRSSSNTALLDSCGFEHAMVGEVRVSGTSVTVSGFHSWVQFYEEEKIGRMNYLGYVRRVFPTVVGANFSWRPATSSQNAVKALGSFFIGTSPEFDLALYTLCALEHPNAICNVQLGGTAYRIQTWDIAHKDGAQIGSSYPAI